MLCVRGYGFSGVSAALPRHPVWEWQLWCNYLPRETLCSLGAWLAELNGRGPAVCQGHTGNRAGVQRVALPSLLTCMVAKTLPPL